MIKILLTAAALTLEVSGQQKTCHALVLSGGGSNGAYEAGVIWGLMHYGNPEDFRYDVVSGVSAGSINTAGISPWEIGDEVRMSEWLSQVWNSVTNDMVWTLWPSANPILDGILKESGLLNDGPGYLTGQELLGQFEGYKRRIAIGSVDVDTGEYYVFTELNTPWSEICDASISSSSIPFVFPPHYYKGRYFMDGGTVWNINIDSAIQRCFEIVDDASQITLDVVILGSYEVDPLPLDDDNTIGNFMRARDLNALYSNSDAISQQIRAYPNLNYRYLFEQTNGYSGTKELNFNGVNTWPLQLAGRQAALEALAAGPGAAFAKYREGYTAVKNLLNN